MIFALGLVLLAVAHVSQAAEICCGATGCFNNNAPFNNLPLPTCPPGCSLRYLMYTRSNRNTGQVVSDTSVPSVYSGARRTVVCTHGWNSDGNTSWLTAMKNAFLDREDINVIVLDWGGCAQLANYNQAASNTRTVGAQTALVFQNLLRQSGSAASRMWCTGHSLGSHVCGHAGMKMPTGSKLGRVTGMDPAGPNFEGSSDKTIGLNPSSANFVDILHTDTEYGTLRDLGHIDFYPTGGRNQPGCATSICSHGRAHDFMIESIKQDCFRATQRCTNYNNLPGSCSTSCTSSCGSFPCAYMGYAADSSCNRSGIYYLTVRASGTYC